MLVYRTEKYQKLKSEIEKQSKKLEKKKEAHGESANLDRSKKRKLEAVSIFFFWRSQFLCCTYVIGILHCSLLQDEEKLKNTNKDLTMVKMKSMFAIGGF